MTTAAGLRLRARGLFAFAAGALALTERLVFGPRFFAVTFLTFFFDFAPAFLVVFFEERFLAISASIVIRCKAYISGLLKSARSLSYPHIPVAKFQFPRARSEITRSGKALVENKPKGLMLPRVANFGRIGATKLRIVRSDINHGGGKMPYFQCSRCQCVEDTSLCRYWSDRFREDLPVCSACDPDIGRWHDQFPRQYPEEGGWVLDKRSGFFWQKGEVESWLGQPIQIISRSDRSFARSGAASICDARPSGDLSAA